MGQQCFAIGNPFGAHLHRSCGLLILDSSVVYFSAVLTIFVNPTTLQEQYRTLRPPAAVLMIYLVSARHLCLLRFALKFLHLKFLQFRKTGVLRYLGAGFPCTPHLHSASVIIFVVRILALTHRHFLQAGSLWLEVCSSLLRLLRHHSEFLAIPAALKAFARALSP